MKDRLRFRVWIPEAKHLRSEAKGGMFYQEDQYLYSFIRRIHDQFRGSHPTQLPFELEDRLMQCTGLKDVSGKLIYEGDIIANGDTHGEDEEVIHECIFSEGCFIFYPFPKGDKNGALIGYEEFSHYLGDLNEVVIIGNIHESPELLTQTKS